MKEDNELNEQCICSEWDGKGYSTCGFKCPVHFKQPIN